jgi:uncharacterized protein YcgI (DUF1989 family)
VVSLEGEQFSSILLWSFKKVASLEGDNLAVFYYGLLRRWYLLRGTI